MLFRPNRIAVVGLLSLSSAACSMMPSGGADEPRRQAVRPAPLVAAPSGSVVAKPLAPPVVVAPKPLPPVAVVPAPANEPPADAAAPASVAESAPAPAKVADASPKPSAGDVEIGRTDLLGGWKINAAGKQCQLFMTLTTWSGGYRASTKGCGNPALQKVAAWNMEGRQIQLINDSGATVARLYPSSKSLFNGQTEGGGPVSVSR